MPKDADCGCESRPTRRRVLQAGLAAAAAGTMGGTIAGAADALARDPAPDSKGKSANAPKVNPIDIHAHYFPEGYLALLAKEGRNNPDRDPRFTDLKLRIAEMDKTGVAVHAISLTNPMVYWGDGNHSLTLAKTWNDEAVEAHLKYPTRLLVFATLPMQFPDLANAELDRVVKLPGVRGVYMGTNVAQRDLDDPLFEPIFAHIEQLGLPVFLHPNNVFGGDRLKDHYLGNFIGNPVDGTIAAAHLIFGGVLDRHPNLTVCLSHSGGALPVLIGRWDHGWRVRKEVKDLPQAPSKYLRRFMYDSIAHSKDVMEFVIKQVGVDRIMVGSDYCFDMGMDEPVKFVQELDLPGAQRNMILNGNASKLLKL